MRVAVIADVHGNLGALDAVLSDIRNRKVDLTVNLGDTVSGPLQPRETADRLMELEYPTIRGNHERQLVSLPLEQLSESDRFASLQLQPHQSEWLAGFPPTLRVADDILMCHGTPASDVDYFLETVDENGCHPAPPAEVVQRAAGCSASLILCGHTHLPRFLVLADGRSILNPGSVGLQAYTARWPHAHKIETGSPQARYTIATRVENRWKVECVQVDYDWEAAARRAEENGRPEWALALRAGKV
jgi:predicted phosphodiesterase